MADDSSPEPGEAPPPRGRIVQLKASSRGSMERQSLESGRAGDSPAYSSHSQQWRGSPPHNRLPRPYNNTGYYKRQQPGYEAAGAAPPYQRERVFSRSRGRSVSRSPSRASLQRARSRSRSPSPKSPPRSRSRSRSFSPRGHRTFANWERGGRNSGAGQYMAGRGGRGGNFDVRQRRERDSRPRGGGRGGGRFATYQRGNRFYPKEVRYKPQQAPMPRQRSISRDRSSNEGGMPVSGSYRDRQMRDRDPRDYEQAYRGRTRERELSNRSTSLVRTASFSSEYYRDSEPSASAEEGEEKPEESYVTTSERSVESHTPSDAGSIERDSSNVADSSSKRQLALPPRPIADSYASSRREARVAREADESTFRSSMRKTEVARDANANSRLADQIRSPVRKTESTRDARTKNRFTDKEVEKQVASGNSPIISRDGDEVKSTANLPHDAESAEGNASTKSSDRDAATDEVAVKNGDQTGRSRVTDMDENAPEAGLKTDNDPAASAEEASTKIEDTTDLSAKTDHDATQASTNAAAEVLETRPEVSMGSPQVPVTVESDAQLPEETRPAVDWVLVSSERKSDVDGKNEVLTIAKSDASPSKNEEQEHVKQKPGRRESAEQTSPTQDDADVDMDKPSRSIPAESATQAQDVELKKAVPSDDKSIIQAEPMPTNRLLLNNAVEPTSSQLGEQSVHFVVVSTIPLSKPTEAILVETPEVNEVEEGEMVAPSSKDESVKKDFTSTGTSSGKIGEAAPSQASLPQAQNEKRASDSGKYSDAIELGRGREKRAKIERSRTDPSATSYRDNNKPRSTSFSSFGLPIGSQREGNAGDHGKTLFRAEPVHAMAPTHEEKRGIPLPKQNEVPFVAEQDSFAHSGRPALDRRASFSTLQDRSSHVPSEARPAAGSMGYTGGSRTARASSSFSKASPPKPYAGLESKPRRALHDEIKKEDAARRELLRAGSMDSMIDRNAQRAVAERAQGIKESSASASNSPNRRNQPREELPALPDIPLPSAIRDSQSPTVLGEGTPTKRHRPRLGWGQGLVAPSPPQPAKRPRIGWGQGLMQPKDDTTASPSAGGAGTVVDSPAKTTETNAATVVAQGEQQSVDKLEPAVSDPADSGDSSNKEQTTEGRTLVAIPETEKQMTPVVVEEASAEVANEAVVVIEADKDADVVMAEEGDEQDEAAPEPSKEEILSTIDVLDSDIAGVKKQIKALQRTIATADTEQESSSVSVNAASSGNRDASAKLDTDTVEASAGNRSGTSPRDSSNAATDEPLMASPVKLAVDSRFVELLAGVFSENLRKTAAANALLPKRMEQGQLATRIYHQPSDYAFYQANIARGSALADQVRLKVRMRNRARYEHMKKLARDYVELKKSWKTGVKRMEKDRKRQDKLRLKQLQKQKLKSMGESGPIRTTNTNHQSPHVQQLVAAEKAAEAAGSEGGAVRTSSRLTNNSSGDLENNDLEKLEQAKAQALIDQEVRKKRLKNALSTVIPDMLITPVERQQRYFTRFVNGQSCMADGLVTDWKLKEKAEMKVNPWNDLEKCIYMDKFLQFPKNFPRISSFLRNKTTGDVIAFYYRTKKVADYKALLREQQLRRRGAGSKNTWSCWNLSACAAICLGVQFPEKVAKLLLHPSNFRSHQASDNILNSAGAQRLLRSSSQKPAGGDSTASTSAGTSSEITGALSALELVSGSDHTPSVRPSTPGEAVQLDDIASSGDSDTSDEEKFNLYTQQLEQFIAGQQRPFLVDYAALLSDNSYSTGYEVTTLSIEERLKKYPVPSKELESASAVATGSGATGASQETSSKGKQQSNSAGSSANAKTSGPHMTKKELKQQRKLKKMQEGAATSASASSQSVGNAGVEKSGNHNRKKSAAGSSTAPNASGSRNAPRISIPGDDKVAQGGKKTSRNGGGAPGSRRNNQHLQANATNASPKPPAVPSLATAMAPMSAAATSGPAKKSSGGNATPHGNARTSSPSANATVGGNAGGAAPAKRVVQKWTEGEKADFLKYFSQYGKDWATLTENIPTKTAAQIKNYYQNYKNRLNLQDILKRRIENAAASGGAKGGTHSTTASVLSPRSAAAGLMSGTLRQMGRSVDLPTGMSMGMPSGSMAINAADPSMSFQAALNAAQPGMHGVNVMSELSANQFGMQAHPDQQQQSREMMNPASSSERYLKLLNMQHQLQIMQFQQQQKSQGMTAENAGAGGNNSSYHESQMNAANAQRLYQYSRQQQQQQVPPQQLSLQALQQMGMQTHAQGPAHSQMMQLPMQQQQTRGSFSEMGHPNSMYQSMGQMQPQHPQAMAAAQMGMSPTSAQRYDTNSSADGGVGQARGNAGGVTSQMGRHSMMNMAMVNNTAGGNGSAAANSPHHPPMGPSRSMAMESSRPPEVEPRQTAWRSAPAPTATSATANASPKLEISTTSSASSGVQDNASKGRAALAPPAPPPVQPVRSRMSFSSILNESESPRDDATPRGNGSMVIKQQESPRVSEQQQREQQQREQQQQMQQRQQPQLHITMPPSSGELVRSPVAAPSPTAHLLPRRSSAPTPHNRMGLMSSLLNVSSPERRTTNPGHQSPLMQQQQQLQRQMQAARYYDAATSSAEAGGSASRGSMATMVSGMPASSTMSSTMARSSPSDTMSSSMASYSNTSAQMAVALSRSGSASSTSSAVSANAASTGDPRAQQQMWNYSPQIRYEEAELLRRAQRAEEEAARAAAAAAAAARALQEAQKARQQALDMAANMARYNSAMQQQQQAQQQQPQQYQQLQYQQLQAHHQQQQMQVQQHEYHQQHQAQQLHQQQMQHQALHHHLQLMQQQQRPANVSPSDHLLQQQLHQQQQHPPRGPQSGS